MHFKAQWCPNPATRQRDTQGPEPRAGWSPTHLAAFSLLPTHRPGRVLGLPGLTGAQALLGAHARAGESWPFWIFLLSHLSWTSPCSTSTPIKGSFLLHPASLLHTPHPEPLRLAETNPCPEVLGVGSPGRLSPGQCAGLTDSCPALASCARPTRHGHQCLADQWGLLLCVVAFHQETLWDTLMW